VQHHERNDVPPRRARHRLVLGHPPLLSVDESRELPGGDQTMQHRAGHVVARPIRHGDSGHSRAAVDS
jgi:hypothetical protein